MPQTAKAISEAKGKPVEFFQVPIEEIRKGSADFAAMLEWFDRVGYDVDIPATSKESGIRPTSFREWVARANWSYPAPAVVKRRRRPAFDRTDRGRRLPRIFSTTRDSLSS